MGACGRRVQPGAGQLPAHAAGRLPLLEAPETNQDLRIGQRAGQPAAADRGQRPGRRKLQLDLRLLGIPGHVVRQHNPRVVAQRRIFRRRFLLEYIERRAEKGPAIQCFQQCPGIDHRSARGIHQNAAFLHPLELASPQQVAGFGNRAGAARCNPPRGKASPVRQAYIQPAGMFRIDKGSAATMRSPQGLSLRATALPIWPRPTSPSVLPSIRCTGVGRRTSQSPSIIFRCVEVTSRTPSSSSAMAWEETSSMQ